MCYNKTFYNEYQPKTNPEKTRISQCVTLIIYQEKAYAIHASCKILQVSDTCTITYKWINETYQDLLYLTQAKLDPKYVGT